MLGKLRNEGIIYNIICLSTYILLYISPVFYNNNTNNRRLNLCLVPVVSIYRNKQGLFSSIVTNFLRIKKWGWILSKEIVA